MIFAADLVTILTTNPNNIGTITFALNVNVFTTSKASIPKGQTLQIREYGGMGPLDTQNSTAFPAIIRPTAQLIACGESPAIAWEMADTAFQIICRVRNQFIGADWYRKVHMIQSQPFDMGLDVHKQSQWAFNVMGDFSRRS